MTSVFCPHLAEQAKEENRTALISCEIADRGLYTFSDEHNKVQALTEHISLVELLKFLKSTQNDETVSMELKEEAEALSESLNYIGTSEFEYATSVLATYYK